MLTDFEHILISAERYALGRRTYISSIVPKYIESQLPRLSEHCRYVLLQDLENTSNYGDDCDREDWLRLRTKLNDPCYGCMGSCFGDCINCKRGNSNV